MSNDIYSAIAAMQSAGLVAVKNRQVKGGKMNFEYASLADVWLVCRPLLAEHAICITQSIGGVTVANNRLFVAINTRITHTPSGTFIEDAASVPIPENFGGNFAQAWGSAISYGKRYAICSLLGVVTGDDDDAARANDSYSAQAERAVRASGAAADPHEWRNFTEDRWKAAAVPNDLSGKTLGSCTPAELEILFQRHPHDAAIVAASVARCEKGLQFLKTTYKDVVEGRDGWPASMADFTSQDVRMFLSVLATQRDIIAAKAKTIASTLPKEGDPILFDDSPPA